MSDFRGVRRTRAARLALAGFILTAVAIVPATAYTPVYTIVAVTGQHAPGTPAGVTFNSSDTPVVDGVGQVAYKAFLSGTGVVPANSKALYVGLPTLPQLLVREGDAAPGMPGVNYANVATPALGDDGSVAFAIAPSGNYTSLFAGATTSLQLVANAGDPAPGTSTGVNYLTFAKPTLNDAAQIAYFTSLTGTGVTTANNTALYAGSFTAPQLVVRGGNPAPGMQAGVNYSGISSAAQLTLNDAGQIAYLAGLSGTGVTTANNHAIYAGALAAPQPVARTGDAAPGMPAGVNYSSLSDPSFNNGAQVAYNAVLTGTGVTSANNDAIYAGAAASPQPIARNGDAAFGAPAGVTFAGFGNPTINNSGGIVFTAALGGVGVTSANDSAIYTGTLASPQLVVRAGDAVPGVPAGVTFTSLDTIAPPAINDAGQLAFPVLFTGPGVSGNFGQRALYGYDPVLGLVLIAHDGDSFDIGGGVMKTIASQGIHFARGYGDGSPTGLSNNGTVVFSLTFVDNSTGIFTTAIPEPAPFWLLAVIPLAAVPRRRLRAGKR